MTDDPATAGGVDVQGSTSEEPDVPEDAIRSIDASVSASEVARRELAETGLRESEARQRALIEGVPQLVWRALGEGRWTWSSPQWTALTGQAERAGHEMGWLDVVHPDDRELALARWRDAQATGFLEVEFRLRDAGEGRYRWFKTRAMPVRNDRGEILEWLGTSTDIDELRASQERQRVLIAELQHRTRNLVAIIRSIFDRTIRSRASLEDVRTDFTERLAAIGRAQGLLSRSDRNPISIGMVLRTEFDALGAQVADHRVELIGPEVLLHNAVVQTLALAVHELATNATKYGALATAEGRLEVSWHEYADVDDNRHLALLWRESGIGTSRGFANPRTKPGGFGRELIEKALPHELGATTTYALTNGGVRCSIDMALEHPPSQPS